MAFKKLPLLVLVIAAQAWAAPSNGDAGVRWNSILRSKNIFPENYDEIQSKFNSKQVILEELNNLLNQDAVLTQLYTNYQVAFDKELGSDFQRMQTFKETLLKIASHNLDKQSGKDTFFWGVNILSDMTYAEFAALYLQPESAIPSERLPRFTMPANHTAPASVDWRTGNRVTKVKSQGGCGSCALFASTAMVETQKAISSGQPALSLSPQEIIDCYPGNNDICRDGIFIWDVVDYIIDNGVTGWDDYKYTGRKSTCYRDYTPRRAYVASQSRVDGNEGALMEAVSRGPVAVQMHFPDKLQHYDGSVFDEDCTCADPNDCEHAVTVVGYGNKDGKDMWIIKNSHGESWGDRGFFYYARNAGDPCAISRWPTAVTV